MKEYGKKIAKNTLALYFRMLFTMVLGFWTTREVLANLGVVDFGLSNVIGGVVTMFAFLANIMKTSASRFFAVCIGKNNSLELRRVFSLTFYIYLILILILFILLETIGVWVVSNKLVIPIDRFFAARAFFQYSVGAFLFNTLAVPFSAMIIAKEDMGCYAILSVLDAVVKLAVAFCLIFNFFDMLPFYGMLMLFAGIFHFLLNVFIALKKYSETRLMKYWNLSLFGEISKFAGWSVFGGLTSLFSDVLVNVVLNNFFGAVINAARGIAMQVNNGANSFTENFLMAVKPRIMKLYAQREYDEMFVLTCKGAKYGFLLSLFIVIPIVLDADYILELWLQNVPETAGVFVSLVMFNLAIDVFSNPLMTVAQATGKVALYQVVIGLTTWCKLPLSYLTLKMGAPAVSVVWVSIIISTVSLFLRLIIIKRLVFFPGMRFLLSAVFPGIAIALCSFPLPLFIHSIMNASLARLTVTLVVSCLNILLVSYFWGFDSADRIVILNVLKKKMRIN